MSSAFDEPKKRKERRTGGGGSGGAPGANRGVLRNADADLSGERDA